MSELDTLYARWLDGDLSAEEIKSLKTSGEWTELEALVKATKDISLPTYDKESEFEKLMADKRPKPKEDHEATRINMSTILSAAASLLLLLGAIFFLREEAPDAQAQNGETIEYVFSDRSRAILNDGSSISFDDDNWESDRRVKLTGEAIFDVEKGNQFIVETANGFIEVLGTSFNVRAWGNVLYVECYHGRVRVNSKGNSIEITKLQSINVIDGILGDAKTIDNEDPYWTTGSSRFYEENLNSVFAELSRQYDITIDSPILNKKFTGIFNHNDLDKALQQITVPMGLSYNTNQETNHVIISN